MNIIAKKTSTLQNLQRQVNDAGTVAAKAESTYESYVNKSALFQGLLNQANAELATITAQWNQFLALKSTLTALQDTSDDSNLVAQTANKEIKSLIKKWEQVVQQTLDAADAINLAADYIKKRKASNALISNDLVSDATLAANNATTAVKLVINALTAALNSLSSSTQANNSTELTGLYIDMASSALLNDPAAPSTNDNPHVPLENSLSRQLKNATQKQNAVQAANIKVTAEVASAKESLDAANAKLATTQAALKAAQAAVNA